MTVFVCLCHSFNSRGAFLMGFLVIPFRLLSPTIIAYHFYPKLVTSDGRPARGRTEGRKVANPSSLLTSPRRKEGGNEGSREEMSFRPTTTSRYSTPDADRRTA